MNFFTLLLAALPALAHAANNTIHNACNFDIYISSISTGPIPEPVQLSPGNYIGEVQYFHETGTAIKITREKDGLFTAAPVLHFSYSYTEGSAIYYGLSTTYGFAFEGHRISLNATAEGAKDLVWTGEQGPGYTAYWPGETDLELTLCDE